MDTEQTAESWQVESGGKILDTNFAQMTSWIEEGTLLKIDRVRKGDLRWIEAGRVPSLVAVFNAKEAGEPTPAPVVTLTKLGPSVVPGSSIGNPPSFARSPLNKGVSASADPGIIAGPACAIHADALAAYVCETCSSQFCKSCPNSYGGTVKVCPLCGAMCAPLAQVEQARAQTAVYDAAIGEGFGFGDFGRALAYPFKFKLSLMMGAIMFMFFSIGQSVVSFGGIFMLSGAITCFMLANTLTFGILANTVENFSQGKIGLNFMPTFEDFSIWDDVIHPFFLSIGVYIASFGPLVAVGLFAFFMVIGNANKEMNGLQSDAARTVVPELPYTANAVKQTQQVKEILGKDANVQQQRVDAINNGQIPPAENPAQPVDDTEASVERANQLIQQQQKAKLESVVGKTPETKAEEQAALVKQVLGYGPIFLVIAGVCLLWGLLYFPAACAVAGYTHSFTATLNPSVGFDTILRLGGDYVKILLMGLAVAVMSLVIGSIFSAVLSPFDLPGLGNVPARAIGSLFGFYFSVVFSCVIGFALYKAADRLKLYR